MTHQISVDTARTFTHFEMSEETCQLAMQVSPLFLAWLQNKIADYAEAVVTKRLEFNADPTAQVQAILAHERLKNFVEAYQELASELTAALQQSQS